MSQLNIVITGAGSGLGMGAALKLAEAGHRVLGTVQTPQQMRELSGRGGKNLRIEKIDLLKDEDRAFLADQPADVLVNNAAVSETGPIAEQPLELVRKVFDVNVFATLALSQLVARKMVERGGGRIIFMSSMAGLMPIPYVGAYCASKHALEAMAACMNAELKPHNVEVLTFQPGPYNTGFNDRMWATSSLWMDPAKNFTRREDMASTAAILDSQLDPAEAIDALAAVVQAEAPKFRNVVPLAIEEQIRGVQAQAWTRLA